jgi:hypothetical protein
LLAEKGSCNQKPEHTLGCGGGFQGMVKGQMALHNQRYLPSVDEENSSQLDSAFSTQSNSKFWYNPIDRGYRGLTLHSGVNFSNRDALSWNQGRDRHLSAHQHVSTSVTLRAQSWQMYCSHLRLRQGRAPGYIQTSTPCATMRRRHKQARYTPEAAPLQQRRSELEHLHHLLA